MSVLPLLLNPNAGRRSDAARIERAFVEAGLEPSVEHVAPQDLRARLDGLRGAPRVAVAGGDGTLRTAAAALRGSSTVLIPVPAGHLNHFARRLGLETPEAAAAAAAHGAVRTVALGVVRDGRERVFLNTAVVGAYPAVIRLRERIRGYLGLWPAAAVASLWIWTRWPLYDLVIRTDEHELRRRTAMLWIGTGPDSFPAPHEVDVPRSAGEGLELVILPSTHRRHALRLLRALWASRRGRSASSVGLEVLRAPSVEIDTRHRVRLTLDAEPRVLAAPVRVALEPNALRVVCAPEPA